MGNKNAIAAVTTLMAFLLFSTSAFSQDKIYTTRGKVLDGKVTEVGPKQIKLLLNVRPDGPVYVFNTIDIDSIVYSNGMHDELEGALHKKAIKQNIPQLNTWTFDQLGFTFMSVSQSYERRLKNGKVGFRIPLYIGYFGGGIAGVGLFKRDQGVFYPISSKGFSIATGINPKFYLNKHRRVRAFVGPEITIGYTKYKDINYYYDPYDYSYPTRNYSSGTFAGLGKFGLTVNPVDKFTMTFDGGAGAGYMFGSSQSQGLVGLWHIGFAIGTNF